MLPHVLLRNTTFCIIETFNPREIGPIIQSEPNQCIFNVNDIQQPLRPTLASWFGSQLVNKSTSCYCPAAADTAGPGNCFSQSSPGCIRCCIYPRWHPARQTRCKTSCRSHSRCSRANSTCGCCCSRRPALQTARCSVCKWWCPGTSWVPSLGFGCTRGTSSCR